jgi:antitoxin ParD1/3/4
MKTDAMRPLTISLSPQQLARIQQAVDSGNYASNSEVLREALRLWEQREELRILEVSRLRRAYEEGIASGPSVDGEGAFERIRSRIGAAARKSA